MVPIRVGSTTISARRCFFATRRHYAGACVASAEPDRTSGQAFSQRRQEGKRNPPSSSSQSPSPPTTKSAANSTFSGAILAWFGRLDWQRKGYALLTLVAILLIIPRVLLLGAVALERGLVGSVMALEGALAVAVGRIAAFGSSVLLLGFLGYGMWLFVMPRRR